MILDTKESGVKRATTKTNRVSLPRLFEAILKCLILSTIVTTSSEEVGGFVLDYTEAFWQVPLRDEEQKYYCCTATIRRRKKWIVYLRAAQGSTNAPTSWARTAALVMRLTQGIFSPLEVLLMCYADDPLAAFRGTDARRRLLATVMILVWESMGFGLAYPKGQLDQSVHWIGGTISCHPWGVTASIKDSIVTDIQADLLRMAKLQVISKKELHSLLGKLSHVAGLLIVIRPFLKPLWAALACDKPSGAPRECSGCSSPGKT